MDVVNREEVSGACVLWSGKEFSMLRLGIAVCAVGALALAEGFTFTIGNPVASQDFQAKGAAFVFRTECCAEPAKSQVGGTAEGAGKDARRSVALRELTTSKPGVYRGYEKCETEVHCG